jgi:hypothetical protein
MKRVGSNLVFYKSSVKQPKRHQVTEKQLQALANRTFGGVISRDQQKKIIQIVQNWDDTLCELNARALREGRRATLRINMLTLTLSKLQHHDDKYIKRFLLVPFLAKLLRTNPNMNYLWRAEPQLNGNIHFHIFVDRYFDKSYVQKEWNKTQALHGYHNSMVDSSSDIGMPSTRIESLKSKSDAVQYAAKYVSKNEGGRVLEGRLWGCSDSLRKLKSIEYLVSASDVPLIVESVSKNNSHIWVNDYSFLINYPSDWSLIQDSLRLNYSADLALAFNVGVLNTHQITIGASLQQTEWYRQLVHEYGPLTTSYLQANYTLFPCNFETELNAW